MTLWDVRANRWWPSVPVLFTAGGLGLTVLLALTTRLNPWSLLAALFVPYGLWAVRAARTRVRLTPDGVEVRGLRTRVLPYVGIESVEVSPDWEGARSVWVRLRASSPHSAPEVLTPPPEWWHEDGRSLEAVVALIRARVERARDAGAGGARPA